MSTTLNMSALTPFSFMESAGGLALLEQYTKAEGFGLNDGSREFYNNHILEYYMKNVLSQDIILADESIGRGYGEIIKNLPVYPAYGSIVPVDEGSLIIVKLSDKAEQS